MSSPFLTLPERAHVADNSLAFAVEDRYPVSPGHTLVVARREVRTSFDATRDEQTAICSGTLRLGVRFAGAGQKSLLFGAESWFERQVGALRARATYS